jgi:hypothetical protein
MPELQRYSVVYNQSNYMLLLFIFIHLNILATA